MRYEKKKAAYESKKGPRGRSPKPPDDVPVFGIIKSAIGFTSFHLRGLQNLAAECLLVALAQNCRRLHRLRPA